MNYDEEAQSAFIFTGTWKEFAPVAFTNLLLMIATLGLYRFWASARERRYLWARTHFIDAPLEWTGNGKELFVGFLLAMVLIGTPLLIVNYGVQILLFQGYWKAAIASGLVAILIIFYFTGVARFRAIRYRLSRSWWHGINGGSDVGGFAYGGEYMARTTVGYLALGLLIPWAMVKLWARRWTLMSFGNVPFGAGGSPMKLMPRFLLYYLMPPLFLLMILTTLVALGFDTGGIIVYMDVPIVVKIVMILTITIGVYLLLGLIALSYYSAFCKEVVSNMTLGDIKFRFEAEWDDWIKLFAGDTLLLISTLGIGWIFLRYRHWKFFVQFMEAEGSIAPGALTQSRAGKSSHGEGLLDAFDVGAV